MWWSSDPVTSFLSSGTSNEVKGMLTRLIDFLKSCEVTALMTTLSSEVERLEQTDVHVSSLIDTWLVLRDLESGGERNRGLMILKSRGWRTPIRFGNSSTKTVLERRTSISAPPECLLALPGWLRRLMKRPRSCPAIRSHGEATPE